MTVNNNVNILAHAETEDWEGRGEGGGEVERKAFVTFVFILFVLLC